MPGKRNPDDREGYLSSSPIPAPSFHSYDVLTSKRLRMGGVVNCSNAMDDDRCVNISNNTIINNPLGADGCSQQILHLRQLTLMEFQGWWDFASQVTNLCGVANLLKFLDWQYNNSNVHGSNSNLIIPPSSGGIAKPRNGLALLPCPSRTFVRNVNASAISQFCNRNGPCLEATVAVLVAQRLFAVEELVEIRIPAAHQEEEEEKMMMMMVTGDEDEKFQQQQQQQQQQKQSDLYKWTYVIYGHSTGREFVVGRF